MGENKPTAADNMETTETSETTETLYRAVGGGTPPPLFQRTPPTNPHSRGKLVDADSQSELTVLRSFSPKLCLELLPTLTKEQLDYEVNWQQTTLGLDFDFKRRKPDYYEKLKGLLNVITPSATIETIENFYNCSFYRSLTRDFSCLLEQAKQLFNRQSPAEVEIGDDEFFDSAEQFTAEVSGDNFPARPEPVCVLDLDLSDLDVNTVTNGFNLVKIGARTVGFAGSVEYRYGHIRHPPTSYPENPSIDQIFSSISSHFNDPSINKENYTVMVTLYESGKDCLGFHSDNETSIDPSSNIYTVSLGASRDVVFRSVHGSFELIPHTLTHGSVHVMTRYSQDYWEHTIPATDTDTERRVSVTLRKLVHVPAHAIPPIRRPDTTPPPLINKQSVPPVSKPTRILFLTDSIHDSFPAHIFPESANIQCVKRINYELHNIEQWESYFATSNIVFISCGINDLSRYANTYNAGNLITFLRGKIKTWVKKFPKTTFVFNSLLLTRYSWINKEVAVYNDMLFELCAEYDYHNVYFFDSWLIAKNIWLSGKYVLNPHPRANGVHINDDAKSVLQERIRVSLTDLALNCSNMSKFWPLRSRFRSVIGSYTRRLW